MDASDLEPYDCPNVACYKVRDPAADKAAMEVIGGILMGVSGLFFCIAAAVCCCGCMESKRLS